jgi:hypothetical protein
MPASQSVEGSLNRDTQDYEKRYEGCSHQDGDRSNRVTRIAEP